MSSQPSDVTDHDSSASATTPITSGLVSVQLCTSVPMKRSSSNNQPTTNTGTNNVSSPKRSHSCESNVEEPPAKLKKSSDDLSLLRGLLHDNGTTSNELFKAEKVTASQKNNSIPHHSNNNHDKASSTQETVNTIGNSGTKSELLNDPPKLHPAPIQNGQVGNDVIKIDDDDEPLALTTSFDICGICKKSLVNRNPLLLGCLHNFCSECLIQRHRFQFSTTLASKLPQVCLNEINVQFVLILTTKVQCCA